jgi:hypothetical protein
MTATCRYGSGTAAGFEHPEQLLAIGIRNAFLRDGPSDGSSEARATIADRRQTAVLLGNRGAVFSLTPPADWRTASRLEVGFDCWFGATRKTAVTLKSTREIRRANIG